MIEETPESLRLDVKIWASRLRKNVAKKSMRARKLKQALKLIKRETK